MTLEQLKNTYIQSISVSTEDKEQLIEEIESADTLEAFIQVVSSWSQEAVKIGAATVILKRMLQEKTKCIVYVIWGQKANDDFTSGKLVKTDDDCDGHAKRYEFDTENELNAFKKGIEESQGWNEATVVKASEVEIKDNGIVTNHFSLDEDKVDHSTDIIALEAEYRDVQHRMTQAQKDKAVDLDLIHYDGINWLFFESDLDALKNL